MVYLDSCNSNDLSSFFDFLNKERHFWLLIGKAFLSCLSNYSTEFQEDRTLAVATFL